RANTLDDGVEAGEVAEVDMVTDEVPLDVPQAPEGRGRTAEEMDVGAVAHKAAGKVGADEAGGSGDQGCAQRALPRPAGLKRRTDRARCRPCRLYRPASPGRAR